MLVNEEGPWMAFEHLRLKVGLGLAPMPGGTRETDPPGQMPGSLFACVWCMSIYVGTLWAVLHAWKPVNAFRLALPLALSAIACLIDDFNSR